MAFYISISEMIKIVDSGLSPGISMERTSYPPYSPPAYYDPGYNYYTPPLQKSTNGFAIASLCCSLGGILVSFAPIVGIILGFVALDQIKKQPYRYEGKGMATAGVVIGFVVVGLRGIFLLFYIYFIFAVMSSPY